MEPSVISGKKNPESETPTPFDPSQDVHTGEIVVDIAEYGFGSNDYFERSEEVGKRLCEDLGHGFFSVAIDGVATRDKFLCQSPTNIEIAGRNYGQQEPEMVTLKNLDPILEAAQDKQAVFLGESHRPANNDDDKAVLRLLPALRKQGFTHLALELDERLYQVGVNDYLETGNRQVIRDIRDGVYTAGVRSRIRFLKKARRLGFEVIAMDALPKKDRNEWVILWQQREEGMHENISTHLDEDRRIVIVAGAGHVSLGVQTFVIDGARTFYLKPSLAHKVSDQIGAENILSVNLVSDYDDAISHFRIQDSDYR